VEWNIKQFLCRNYKGTAFFLYPRPIGINIKIV
jgi:hypothetical protein